MVNRLLEADLLRVVFSQQKLLLEVKCCSYIVTGALICNRKWSWALMHRLICGSSSSS